MKTTYIKTLKVRIRDKHAKELNRQAQNVNFVWNYINNLSHRAITERRKWLSAFDFHPYTKGSNKELNLHSGTIQRLASVYVTSRKQCKKNKLQWRKSFGSRKSLGWIPVNTGTAKFKNEQIYFNKQYYKCWDSYGLSQFKIKTASFNEDSRGRWYFNAQVEVDVEKSKGKNSVGIDLGCKDAITTSDAEKVTGRWYRKEQEKLGIAQRAKKKNRVRAIYAKIRNRRQDELQKFSTKLVQNNGAIFVGDVSSSKLTKTKMAKSVLDAGWSMFKTMLKYKCDHAGVVFEEVNEAYSTQACSSCGSINHNSPKGRAGLGIREWTCADCGTAHDRDVNAAKNILAVGHYRLAGGIPHLKMGEGVNDPKFTKSLGNNLDEHILPADQYKRMLAAEKSKKPADNAAVKVTKVKRKVISKLDNAS